MIADFVDSDYVPELVPVTKTENRTCILVPAADMVANPWDSQFFITFPGVSFAEGDTFKFSASVRADRAASVGTQTHTNPGGYIHYTGIGTLPFTVD